MRYARITYIVQYIQIGRETNGDVITDQFRTKEPNAKKGDDVSTLNFSSRMKPEIPCSRKNDQF